MGVPSDMFAEEAAAEADYYEDLRKDREMEDWVEKPLTD